MNNIKQRVAGPKDAFSLIRLFQIGSGSKGYRDPLFSHYKPLQDLLGRDNSICCVSDKDGEIVACCLFLLDEANRLCKIHWMNRDPSLKDSREILRDTLRFALDYLKDSSRKADIIYSTTRNISFKQQEITLELGFKVLGIFPTEISAEPSRINGLTAYFFGGILNNKRRAKFSLHPVVKPFFDIVRQQCRLPDIAVNKKVPAFSLNVKPLPVLEIIYAPNYVRQMFHRLRESGALASKLYPFQRPNALITDPFQKIRIFLKIIPEIRFAEIIGEHLTVPVNPVEFYSRISQMLYDRNISYIELINDAADVVGIDCILKAGFIPCGYFPALEKYGSYRRDYVIFSKAFENYSPPSAYKINEAYLKYSKEYRKLLKR
ncbi:hypothetical protein ACFL6Y_05100 [Elusimicrobiota bacterium]